MLCDFFFFSLILTTGLWRIYDVSISPAGSLTSNRLTGYWPVVWLNCHLPRLIQTSSGREEWMQGGPRSRCWACILIVLLFRYVIKRGDVFFPYSATCFRHTLINSCVAPHGRTAGTPFCILCAWHPQRWSAGKPRLPWGAYPLSSQRQATGEKAG